MAARRIAPLLLALLALVAASRAAAAHPSSVLTVTATVVSHLIVRVADGAGAPGATLESFGSPHAPAMRVDPSPADPTLVYVTVMSDGLPP